MKEPVWDEHADWWQREFTDGIDPHDLIVGIVRDPDGSIGAQDPGRPRSDLSRGCDGVRGGVDCGVAAERADDGNALGTHAHKARVGGNHNPTHLVAPERWWWHSRELCFETQLIGLRPGQCSLEFRHRLRGHGSGALRHAGIVVRFGVDRVVPRCRPHRFVFARLIIARRALPKNEQPHRQQHHRPDADEERPTRQRDTGTGTGNARLGPSGGGSVLQPSVSVRSRVEPGCFISRIR